LLVQIGQRLASVVRAEDTVARLGGDEFVILMEGFGDENFPSTAASRILNSFKEPFLLDTKTVYITASIGIVAADAAYQTAIEIMRDADLAMYEAKRRGKSRYVLFSPELRLDAINRLTIDSDLRKALDQNELVLHYQPVVSLATNALIGFEALIRWQHPVRGLIGPSEFIPIAENSGVIDSITCYTLQEACRQLQEWQALFKLKETIFVSVNISPLSLRQTEFIRWVKESLRGASLPPQCLTLEIVETAFIQDADLASHVLNDLRQFGIGVCLDDFGIGYSSFGFINQYPIDILKIDRSFVNHVTETREVGAIVRAITALTRELNIQAVAEGIETQAQLDFMKQTGCQYGQGYLLAKPMNGTAAQSFLQKTKTSE
jgi:predicted signal transduction protein with EAL and GGDEF domain